MRLKLLVLSIFSLSCTFSAFSQKEITITKADLCRSVDLNMPVLLDSTNLKGDKFKEKDLLETFVSEMQMSDRSEQITTDPLDYFTLSRPANGARMHLLKFRYSTNSFVKTKIKVFSTSMFEMYVNGVKQLSKTTIDDSLAQVKSVIYTASQVPATYEVHIKYLSLSTNKSPEKIKIAIEPENEELVSCYTILKDEQKRNITIQDIIEGKRVTSVSVSPNGNFAILNYNTVKQDGKSLAERELFSLKTSRRFSLPTSEQYRWMPISNRFYCTRELNGKTQLIAIDPETMQEQVIYSDIPKGNFTFSPDEKILFYTDLEEAKENKSNLVRLQSPEDRQKGYENRYFISLFDLSKGIKQRLTFGKQSTYLQDISPDSKNILFSVREETNERPFMLSSMYLLNIQTQTIDTLWQKDGFARSASFSLDGKNILILASADAFGGIGKNIPAEEIANGYNVLAYTMNLENKQVVPISKNFAPSINSAEWHTDGNIYVRVTDKDRENIYSYNISKKEYTHLPLQEDVIRSFSLAKDNSGMAVYMGVSKNNSTRAYKFDLKKNNSILIADPSETRLAGVQLSESKDWTFTTSDSTQIDGLYYLPPNFDASKKYPLIVYYYAGTMPTSRSLEGPYPPQVYAALGYVVYVLQPSGTTGYGQEFAARHVNAWGKRTAEDIIEGTKKFVSEHSFINDKKIGCIGASYGGFMTMYLQTQTDMFAAAVSHAGISSIASYWGEGYWGYTYSGTASANSYPWNNKDLYVNQSPLFNADKINTPLLLLHGTDDTNVPIGESIQMYTALKILNKPVEFVQVKGENHGVRDYKKRIEWNYTIYAWFAKWLQDESGWWNNLYPN